MTPVVKQAFLLNTLVTLTIYDHVTEVLADECLGLIRKYEKLFSKFDPTSEVYALNHRSVTEPYHQLPEDLYRVIESSVRFSKISRGGFDITTEPLSSLWHVTGQAPCVPTSEAIEQAKRAVGWEKLQLFPQSRKLKFLSADTRIDLGGIAKGYIADRAKEYLLLHGVRNALINLGGNVLCLGEKPDGQPFTIGVQDPFSPQVQSCLLLRIRDMSVVSSGVYQRCFTHNGKNYHHLIDPRSGYPFDNGISSVTILSPLSLDGDGLSTCCFALGIREGSRLLDSLEGIFGIFILEDGRVHYTQGARDFVVES